MTKLKNHRARTSVSRGFSLIELMIVVGIVLVVAAIAVPAIRQTVATYELDVSGQVVASKLQDARMAAVKANTPYYASFTPGPGPNFVTAAPLALRAYNATLDPTATTSKSVVFQAPVGLNFTQLNLFVGGAVTAGTTNGAIGFNARGLPCQQGANLFSCPAGGTGFIWFMQSLRNKTWEAVTVSPTGHIRCWRQTAAGVWQ
jgi:prepilin-type N-terminal cleavage/methylation domain-containing protein